MPLWRCPHCSTPQEEAARCWVCRRSTTSCATCRNFRRSIASGLGMCGLDPGRLALTGAEMRPCWAAPDPVFDESPTGRARVAVMATQADLGGRRPRTFVPVEELAERPEPLPVQAPARAAQAPSAAQTAGGWSLWGDPDP